MAVHLVFEGSVIPHQCYRSMCVPQSILDASQDSIPARAVMVDVTSPDPEVQVASLLPLSPVHLGSAHVCSEDLLGATPHCRPEDQFYWCGPDA